MPSFRNLTPFRGLRRQPFRAAGSRLSCLPCEATRQADDDGSTLAKAMLSCQPANRRLQFAVTRLPRSAVSWSREAQLALLTTPTARQSPLDTIQN